MALFLFLNNNLNMVKYIDRSYVQLCNFQSSKITTRLIQHDSKQNEGVF